MLKTKKTMEEKIKFHFKEIEKNLNFLQNGRPVEVRMLKVPGSGTVSGYYEDYQKMAMDVKRYDGKSNVFFTLNEFQSDITARSKNHLTSYAKATTTDKEIIRRRWLLIDVDPRRPSGVSSSDEEHDAALKLAAKIKGELQGEGFTCIVSCDSGNGAHLLVPVDFDTEEETNALCAKFLKILDEKYSTETCEVDTTTSNLSRICKLYGTTAVKGDSTSKRPHRKSMILEDIENFALIPLEKEILEAYVAKYQKKPGTKVNNFGGTPTVARTSRAENHHEFNVETWVESKGFTVTKIKDIDKGTLFEIDGCMFGTEHDEDKGFFIIQFDDGKLHAKCHHAKCNGLGWNDLWNKYESAHTNPNNNKKRKKADEKKSQHELLYELIEDENHKFVKDSSGEIYVVIPKLSGKVYKLMSEAYKVYLIATFHEEYNFFTSRETVKIVLDVIKGKVLKDYECKSVFRRTGSLDKSTFYYNLNSSKNEVVVVKKNADGLYNYEVEEGCTDVLFVASPSMQEQVRPIQSDTAIEDFMECMDKYYGILNKKELLLHNVLLVYRFLWGLEQPIAVFVGQSGSGKTTLCSMDSQIINPAVNNVNAKPNNERDWTVLLNNSDIVVVDNVSVLTKSESDLLCQTIKRYSTSSQRKLYSDDEQKIFQLYTAIYLSSIGLVSHQTDFLDRTIFFHTKRFNEYERKEEFGLRTSFEEDIPKIISGIFKIIVDALNLREAGINEHNEKRDGIFLRITEFETYGRYIALAMGYDDSDFVDALKENDYKIKQDLIDQNDFATIVGNFVKEYGKIRGTASEICAELKKFCESKNLETTQDIRKPSKFGRSLNEFDDVLKTIGVIVEKRKSNGVRIIDMRYEPEEMYGGED